MNPGRRALRWIIAIGVAASGTLVASAQTVPPSGWPNTALTKPMIEGWPNALRVYGDNRYQTGLAAAYTLRGAGADDSFPYGNPDPATTQGWWGLNTCPRSIIVVAGDSPTDALAASSLSDPTGSSSEPFLQRSAAADPVFYPPGGFARVDTDFAPILVTSSARQGATQLDIATRLAAQDMRNGGCTTARQAIIVGGTRAIASTVDSELVAIGYDEVFRVAGSTRYSTARLIAESLGTTAPTATTCLDVRTNDGSARTKFYANATVEYRTSATSCQLLPRTVVITDGITGADALAAGWWTSFWQVPILLHDGTDDLPRQTSEALQTLDIENIVVLGGTSRVSDAVANEAKATAGADEVIRISGDDRYATSVAMAKYFGGWWPTGDGADFAGSTVCVAASSGGVSGRGWPDALSAGPWCGRAGGAAANAGTPIRALAPFNGAEPGTTADAAPARPVHDFVPVVLIPAGASTLPSVVSTFLSGAFPASGDFCTGDSAPDGCVSTGFAVVFGGPSIVTAAQIAEISRLVGAGEGGTLPSPELGQFFLTTLDLSPVFDDPQTGETASSLRLCTLRAGYSGIRWLRTVADTTSTTDLVDDGAYATDGDDVVRTPGVGRPLCVPVSAETAQTLVLSATGPTGQVLPLASWPTFSLSADDAFRLAADLTAAAPATSSGADSSQDDSAGGTTTWTFTTTGASIAAVIRGTATTVTAAELSITLERGENDDDILGPDTFTGEFTLTTSLGTVTGRLTGEAVLTGGAWQLRGRVDVERGTSGMRNGWGGVRATVTNGVTSSANDDAITWRVDGVRAL